MKYEIIIQLKKNIYIYIYEFIYLYIYLLIYIYTHTAVILLPLIRDIELAHAQTLGLTWGLKRPRAG